MKPFCFSFLRLAIAAFFVSAALPVSAITLTGSNGRAVEFFLIKSATPKGITVQMVADGPILGIPWAKLDLKALEENQKLIFSAYERTKDGETVELDLGATPAPPASADGTPGAPATPSTAPKYPGWSDTKIGNIEFMIQLPAGVPKGVLLLSLDDFGDAFRYVQIHERGSGLWSDFQNKLGFALLSYDLGKNTRDATKIDEFIYAQKGSGKALISALNDFAVKLKQPALSEVPIAIYGAERTGAAFAYHFAQWMPERTLAVSLSKGAFYDAEPTEASLKVPIMFIWGQYCTNAQLWGSENSAEPILAKYASKAPNWSSGREFRGKDEQNPEVIYFGQQYLLETIPMRLNERKPKPAAPKPEAVEADEKAGEAKPPVQPDAKPEEEPEEEKTPLIRELDRSKGMMGNLATGDVFQITDPAAAPGENETFLPNAKIGGLWKKFLEGELEPKFPGKTQ